MGGGAPTRDSLGNIVSSHMSFARARNNYSPALDGDSDRAYSPNAVQQARNHSPTQREVKQMKPSNKFAEITEELFERQE